MKELKIFLITISFFALIWAILKLNSNPKEKVKEVEIVEGNIEKKENLQKDKKVQITNEMIKNYIKNDSVKMKEINKEVEVLAKKRVDNKTSKISLDEIFVKNPKQLESYRNFLSISPTKSNKGILLQGLTLSIEQVDRIIQDLQKGGLVVPLSIIKLLQQLKTKEKQVNSFKIE
jgi:hypothetical protein